MKIYNVLVANSNNNQLTSFCDYLKTSSRLHIANATNGKDAIDAYKKENPNVFIMDTNFKDISYNEVIDKISITRKECKNCNIILTTYPNEISKIYNVEKIYKILCKDFSYNILGSAVQEICVGNKYAELDEIDLKLMLVDLKLNINSSCTKYLIEAIYQCYYYPNLLNNLDDVIKSIACQFEVPEDIIRYSFRNALRPVNNYRNGIKNSEIMNLFDESRNITPKYFLDIITTYLHKKNSKSK